METLLGNNVCDQFHVWVEVRKVSGCQEQTFQRVVWLREKETRWRNSQNLKNCKLSRRANDSTTCQQAQDIVAMCEKFACKATLNFAPVCWLLMGSIDTRQKLAKFLKQVFFFHRGLCF